jgi:diguanylate cyclase (GGDEF)-like protein/PAS domain S-box-containing protein
MIAARTEKKAQSENAASRSKRDASSLRDSERSFRDAFTAFPDGVLLLDRSGTIRYCNPAASAIFGIPEETLVGSAANDLYRNAIGKDGTPIEPSAHPMALSIKGIAGPECVHTAAAPSGTVRWISVKSSPLCHQNDPVPYGAVVSVRDVPIPGEFDRLRHLSRSREMPQGANAPEDIDTLEQAIESINHGFIVHDAQDQVIFCNSSAAAIVGMTREQLLNVSARDPQWHTIREDGSVIERQDRPPRIALRTGAPQHNVVVGIRYGSTNLAWLSVSSTPLFHAGETKPWGTVTTLTDFTSARIAADTLQRSEARLVEAQRVARLGNWEYDLITEKISWSKEMYRLLNFDPENGEPTYDELLTHFHPDEIAERDSTLRQCLVDGLPFQFDIRTVSGNASVRWAHVIGEGEKNADGHVIRLFGTVLDITERAESEQRFRVLFEKSPHAHLLLDDNGILDCNDAAVAILGATDRSDLLLAHPAALSPELQPDGKPSRDAYADAMAATYAKGFHRFEWTYRRMSGEPLVVEETLSPVRINDRLVLISVWQDLTERKRTDQYIQDYSVVLQYQNVQLEAQNSRLEALATTDSLTGLKNRHAFEQGLGVEFMLARRFARPVSAILLDVDHFKQFNDEFGHPAGDEVLKTVAKLLRANTRPTDLVARYGGEEFVVVLPETEISDALALAERIRQNIEREPWPLRNITASFGVVDIAPRIRNERDLIARADEALYRAKASGRNCISTNVVAHAGIAASSDN